MITQQKILKALSVVFILGGMLLQMAHLVDPSNARIISTIGFILNIVAYSQQVKQLQAENVLLRQQLEQGQELQNG